MRAILTAFDGKLKGEMQIREVQPVLYLAMPMRLMTCFSDREPMLLKHATDIKKATFEFSKRLDDNTVLYELTKIN